MRKSIGRWKLPQPLDIQEDNEWLPVPKIARVIPFGYELDKDNENLLQPISFELDCLDAAKDHIKQYSYRQVANWLTSKTGRTISHVGLMKRIKNGKQNQNKVRTLRRIAEVAQDAIQTAQGIEEKRIGAKAR